MTNTTNDYLQNPSNPFYLHPNENPALVLVFPVLTGKNYHSWSRAMRMSLVLKNKIKFIDGIITVPPITDLMYPAWEKCNMMVLSWITRSLSPAIAQSILWIDKASDVWKDLRERFSQGDIFRISDLQEEIYGFKQGDLFVIEYFTEFKILWEELLNFLPVPGLNDRFANVRSQIMLLDSLPSINKVFSLTVQQERQMDLGEDFSSKALVNTKLMSDDFTDNGFQKGSGYSYGRGQNITNQYQFNKNFSGNSSNVKVCTYCEKQRHTVDTCYKKHGFPPGYKFKNSGSSANQVTVEDQSSGNTDNITIQVNSPSIQSVPFTQEQIQQLLALIQPPNLTAIHTSNQVTTGNTLASSSLGNSLVLSCISRSNLWILDTGATDHICFSLSSFTSYKKINPIFA
ncbi:uncharacterized protein LOC131182858 [Hevea brasiliensis]|uniref:uncharacterized protein LOC131182858 n=1 Tax=Hevea brasiliensis TaxID=3981 RepID=UPI0025ECFD9C|nr:uncharacterized protein LOC131182858 [Hevea brasiliensis]